MTSFVKYRKTSSKLGKDNISEILKVNYNLGSLQKSESECAHLDDPPIGLTPIEPIPFGLTPTLINEMGVVQIFYQPVGGGPTF